MTTPVKHILVDAHVHIHEHFDLNRLFLISLQNFRKALNQFKIFEPFECFLLLTESSGVNRFTALEETAGRENGAHDFSVERTAESGTLKVTTGGGQHLFVVNGRQIVTSEKLEILALGLPEDYPDGRPLHYVIEDLAASSCLRVLPWGAGKWLGNRGKIVSSLVATWESGPLFLGDNGNRPAFWPLPKVFDRGREKEIYNLPGSDPLPFPEAEKKAGNNGFMIRGQVDPESPFESLMSAVLSSPHSVIPFGTPESFIPFIKNQISMQLFKRRR